MQTASFMQTFVASLVLLAVLVVMHVGFEAYWAITFSACVVYATMFNDFAGRWVVSAMTAGG